MEAEAGEQAQDGGAQPAPPLRRHQGGPQDPFPTGVMPRPLLPPSFVFTCYMRCR